MAFGGTARTRLLTFIIFFFSGDYILGSDGLKNVHLEAPSYVRRGEEISLRCNYDTELESLYALKWYRGSEEFYRYLPKEVPPKQVFAMSGISVDFNGSDDHNVILSNASSATNGKYKCVVSAEGNFQTIYDAKDIQVVAIGYDSPKLFLDKESYQPGDVATANCLVERTNPTANITWYINDKQPEDRHILPRTVVDEKDPTLFSVSSRLLFNVSNSYSPMSIKCRGEVYDLYNMVTSIKIQPKAPAQYPSSSYGGGMPDPLRRSNVTYRGSGVRFLGESHLSHLLTAQLILLLIILPRLQQHCHTFLIHPASS